MNTEKLRELLRYLAATLERFKRPTVTDVYEAAKAWPADVRAKLSLRDMRRMNGWAPRPTGAWTIDHSAGRPILAYENCSVIEDEQARYVLGLIAADMNKPPNYAQDSGIGAQAMTTDKRPELPLVQSTAPERIFLAVAEEEECRDHPFPDANNDEVCWSVDQPLAVCVPYIRADLAACEAYGRASAVPDGYVLAPVEATMLMMEAGLEASPLVIRELYASGAYTGTLRGWSDMACGELYAAMLSARPSPPADPPAQVTEELVEACKVLKNLVEGAPMRRWVDQNGERLKDQPEWVRFYNALTAALRAREWK